MTLTADTVLHHLQTRYTCKAYDPTKTLDETTLYTLLECLRLTPSSINIQPWHFFVTTNTKTKERITRSMIGNDSHNVAKVTNAACVLLLCSRTRLDTHHLDTVLTAEKEAGRFANEDSFAKRQALCQHYINQYDQNPDKLAIWAEQQTFIALGQLLLSAQLLGVQATAIGGYDKTILDNEFDLAAKQLSCSVIVALGYASKDDFNQNLPKSRLPTQMVISHL